MEAILFTSDKALSLDELCRCVPDRTRQDVRTALDDLRDDYDRNERGMALREIGGGYRLLTRPVYHEWVKASFRERRSLSLSEAALESLAIIALKEPIIVPDIDRIRNVSSGGVVRTLLKLRLIRALGRKDVVGRPVLYGVAPAFYDHFGLRDRKHLFEIVQSLPLGHSDEEVRIIGPEDDEDPYSTAPEQ